MMAYALPVSLPFFKPYQRNLFTMYLFVIFGNVFLAILELFVVQLYFCISWVFLVMPF